MTIVDLIRREGREPGGMKKKRRAGAKRRGQMKMIGNRVLVKLAEPERKSAGGIIIPQNIDEKVQEGTVVAIGPAEEITVKVRDRVLYDRYAGTALKLAGKDHLVLKFDDILAVID